MNFRVSLLLFVLISLACKKEKTIAFDSVKKTDAIENEYLIEAEALLPIINNTHIKVIDFRKKQFYNQEHIVGAVQMWRDDIEDTSYAYKGMKASAAQIEKLFGSLGISTNDTLVVYDNKGLCETARLWWILQNYQYKNIKMLHGGIEAWKATQGAVTAEKTLVESATFKLSKTENRHYSISKEEVLKALETDNTILIDTRTLDEFNGVQLKNGAAKAGRIPKSLHKDWAENIHYHSNQKLKSIETLKNIYINQLGLNKNDSIILYCHSGVRSAHTTFVLTELLGFKNVRNYDGSWTEWSHFSELPFENNRLIKINE